MYVNKFRAIAGPVFVVTTTSTIADTPYAGIVTLILLALITVNVAGTPPINTLEVLLKLLPKIIAEYPPLLGPLFGVIEPIDAKTVGVVLLMVFKLP